jgi:hypothetical protein
MKAKLAVVVWEDASFFQNIPTSELKESHLIESVSVGFVFKKKNEIVLIQTIQGEVCDALFIPKKWVKSITYYGG